MNVRELVDGLEYICDESGEVIRCPICNEIWVRDVEGDVEHGECPHLRFMYSPDGGFDIFNNWSAKTFINNFETALEIQVNDDSFENYATLFKAQSNAEIDEIVFHCWDDFPLVQWEIYWGFKND